jgi:hypothetical protein
MTRKVGTPWVRFSDQVRRFVADVVTTYQNSDAVVRFLARCALAALAFPAGVAVKLIWV